LEESCETIWDWKVF